MEKVTTTVVDVALKGGIGKKGRWTLYSVKCGDGNTYKTFDDVIGGRLIDIKGKPTLMTIHFEAKDVTFEGREGKPVSMKQRDISSITPAEAPSSKPSIGGGIQAPPPPPPVAAVGPKAPTDDEKQKYWDNKQRLEFQRMATMSCLRASADIMAACIEAGVEKYKYEDALLLVRNEAGVMYQAMFDHLTSLTEEDKNEYPTTESIDDETLGEDGIVGE